MISNEWINYKLGELCDSVSVTHKFDKETLVFLNTGDIERGKFLHRKYRDVDSMPGQAKKSIKRNDVLFSEIRPANGRFAFVDFDAEDYVVSTKLMVIRANEKILPKFLYFYLTSQPIINWLQHLAESRSGTFPQITFDQVEDIDIVLPPKPNQELIVDFISALDSKIDLNNQINDTLKAITKAIFEEWFVNFNFPGSTGEMIESELGLIPAGWKVSAFEDELEAERGLSYKGSGLESGNAMPMHNLNSVYEGGGYKFEGIKYYSGEYKEKHIIRPGDLIVANTEQGHKYLLIGYPAIVPSRFGNTGIYSHHIYCVRPKPYSYLTADFSFQMLLQPDVREQVVGFANGTTVNMLKIEGLQKPKFVLPPNELVTKFSEIAAMNRRLHDENIEQIATLTSLRNILLPKLMNGEIQV